MKLLSCPLNGPRNISEFVYGGEVRHMPDPLRCDTRQWAEYLYFDNNSAGNIVEWWCHIATSYWFLVERNTVTGQTVRTFAASELFGLPKLAGPDSS